MSETSRDRGTIFKRSGGKRAVANTAPLPSTRRQIAELIADSDLEISITPPERDPCPPSGERDRVMRAIVASDGPLNDADHDVEVHIKGCVPCGEELRSMETLGLHYIETLRVARGPEPD